MGATWKVGYAPSVPLLLLDHDTGAPTGFSYELWQLIASNLNVTSELIHAESFGQLGERGQWGGIVGMVQNGEIDVTLSAMSASFDR